MMSEASGFYFSSQMVSISDATPRAVIYYTADGTTSSRSSPVFQRGSPISVSTSKLIKAIAVCPLTSLPWPTISPNQLQ